MSRFFLLGTAFALASCTQTAPTYDSLKARGIECAADPIIVRSKSGQIIEQSLPVLHPACATIGDPALQSAGFWSFFGQHTFGLSLLPFIAGVLMLFMDGRSKVGWLLLLGGVVIILAGILMNLRIYFEPTSLFNTLLMLVLLFGGVGLIARALKST